MLRKSLLFKTAYISLPLQKYLLWPRVTDIFSFDSSETKMNTAIAASKVDTGGWMPVKRERVTFSDRITEKVQKQIQPHTEKVFSKYWSLPIHGFSVLFFILITSRYDMPLPVIFVILFSCKRPVQAVFMNLTSLIQALSIANAEYCLKL